MGNLLSKNAALIKQQELLNKTFHHAGTWQPANWQNPALSIPDWIAANARAFPDRLAVIDHKTKLNYDQLDKQANQIAHAVLEMNGQAAEVVAIILGLDAKAMITTLGVMKTGKAFTCLEDNFPLKRSSYILDDADVRLILTDNDHLAYAEGLLADGRQLINIDALPEKAHLAPLIKIPLDSTACINYTSGSTGHPKGVIQSHRSMIAHSVRFTNHFHMSDQDRSTFSQSLAWAGPLWCAFGPLCQGAATAPFDIRRYGLEQYVQWLNAEKLTVMVNRIAIRQIALHYKDSSFPSIRLMHLGGDTIYRQDFEICRRQFPNAMFATGLGITEAGRVTEMLIDSLDMIDQDIVPLGYPTPEIKITLVSEDGEEVPEGEVGEIVIHSRYLSEGYWRRPDLTAEKFRRLDLQGIERAYFTGDLGYIRPDGAIQSMGRKDFMVKIRGYQVFMNEIETLLLEVSGVREAGVVAHKLPGGTQKLAAYLVIDPQRFPGMAAVHNKFKDIPLYMIPQAYQIVAELPKTPTGKIDRKNLPLPKQSRFAVTASTVAARNPIEETLAQIWQEILGIEVIGVEDKFLELGGDSLLSTQIINKVTNEFGVSISFREYFNTQTIAEMAALIGTRLDGDEAEEIEIVI